jgi:hypothetical protein
MTRLRFETAREVFDAFPNAASEIQTPPSDDKPLDFVSRLAGGDAPEDALSFCAYLFGRREAVWWASQSVRAMGRPANRDEEKALLIAEAWVREPEEHRRRSALDAGVNGDHACAGVWVALAAGAAGGTLIVAGQPGPPAPHDMTARSVRAAVLIALSAVPTRERAAHIQTCVDLCNRLAQDKSKPS